MEDRPLDETTLVVQAQHGDLAAYEELVARYQDIAYRTSWLVTGDASEAEDVVQTAFIKAPEYSLERRTVDLRSAAVSRRPHAQQRFAGSFPGEPSGSITAFPHTTA